MARGKQAALAANRRAESAHEVIDRLTTELADAKIRARDAEARAERLEGVDALLQQHNNDEALDAALESNVWWSKTAREDYHRRVAGLKDISRLLDDLPTDILGHADRHEFVCRRYPAIMAALSAGVSEDEQWGKRTYHPRTFRHLSDEASKRLEKAIGRRTDLAEHQLDMDAADLLSDVLDAQQAGFTRAEIRELLDLKDP